MDAIVTAGGIPGPDDPLYPLTQGIAKAMLPLAGKPMIQWVIQALDAATQVDDILIIGLEASSAIRSARPLHFLPNQGGMIENVQSGLRKVLEIHPAAKHALIVSSDVPAITGEMLDWLVTQVQSSAPADDDAYYNVVTRQVMETRFPGAKRTYVHLKDMEVCGGDVNVASTALANNNDGLWREIVSSRKNPLQQAALLGLDTLALVLSRQATLEDAVRRVCQRVGLRGRALVCPYAEIGMDVDKPHQHAMLEADLLRARS